MERAAEVGVAVPKVHSIGEVDNMHYIIMDWIDGKIGNDFEDKNVLYKTLGDYSRRLSNVRLEGYGWDFSPSPFPHFTQSWQQAVDQDENYIFSENTLLDLNILSSIQLEKIRGFIHEYREWNLVSCLSHNDICLDNVIISDDGTVYLIDWSNACGQPSPMFEIARVGSGTSAELLAAFVQGHGLSENEWQSISTTVERLKLIHALRAVVWAVRDAPTYINGFVTTVHNLASTWQ